MVRKTSRRGKRFLVIDFSFTKPDGTEGRYRRDAAVQIMAAAQTEEAGRKLGATLYGDPEIIVDRNGVPLRPAALEVKPPPEPTFAEVVARYLVEYAKSRLACSTLDGYQSALKNHLIPKLGNHPFSVAIEVSRSRMLDVELVESGHAVSTRANIQLAFRSVIKFAREVGIQKEVPPVMDLPKRGKKKVPKVPPMADVALLIRTAKHAQHRLLFLLAAHGGLRRGEIRALRCSDVELHNNRLVVRLSRYRQVTKETKSGSDREVPLSPQLREALIAAGVQTRPHGDAVALTTLGKPWSSDGPWRALQAALKRCNLPPQRLHALRGFFVTTLLSGNVPAHVVRELVGHADLSTTQGYAAILSSDQASAVGVLDRAQGGRAEPRRAPRRVTRVTGRGRLLRARVQQRARERGNGLETGPIAAE